MQELYLWALSRPRDSLPSVADKDEDDAAGEKSNERGSVSKPLDKLSVSKAANAGKEFISAAHGSELMNGIADNKTDSKPGQEGIGKPVPWRLPPSKQKQTGSSGVRQTDGVNSSGRGVNGNNSSCGVKAAGHTRSPTSEDSSASQSRTLITYGQHL